MSRWPAEKIGTKLLLPGDVRHLDRVPGTDGIGNRWWQVKISI
jgi:hypothetical protein